MPSTLMVCVSCADNGVDREPTLSGAGRVSMTRHGVMGTYTERSPESSDADADINEPHKTDDTTAVASNDARPRKDRTVDIGGLPG